jgi:type II secretory ATPase GspE/PulE/Tfp pilus assembly ATPase PilB-like protein
VESELTIKLLSGEERSGTLSGEFEPTSGRLEFYCPLEQSYVSLDLDEICYIKFLGIPDLTDSFNEEEFFEEITPRSGENFQLRLIKCGKRIPQGFFAYPTEIDSDYKAIFFTAEGMKNPNKDKPLGEVLEQQGLVEKGDIEAALKEQQLLRKRRVGDILIEQTSVAPPAVEAAIKQAVGNGSRKPQVRVGDILIEAGLVSRVQIEAALREQASGKRKRIGLILIENGLITEDQLLAALAQKFDLEVVDLDDLKVAPEALRKVPREMIERMQVLPLSLDGANLTVATATPTDLTIGENLRFATNCQIRLVCARASQIGEKIADIFDQSDDSVEELIDELDELDVVVDEEPEVERITESDSKVINLVNKVLLDANRKGISDIHFEPGMGPQPLKIRYRKDGICFTVHQIAATYKAAVISRLKIISKLDIAEHRRPQSGKILLKQAGERIEYRVEITPTIGGQEDAVLRVLSSSRIFKLSELGFSERNYRIFHELLAKPYGIILCVGPTGSGKTTSLHAALAEINTPDTKIWTAEDPVEITQEGLRQVQVHAKIGFTFEDALRSFLRADPDVIMIGEMRDPITAKTAIGASLTGHRVFSTLHTNNAPETVVRLIEMGMDPFNFADAMLGILAQRLARRLCRECKEPYHPKRAEYDDLVKAYGGKTLAERDLPAFSKELTLMRAKGCEVCESSGYNGRIAVHELLVNSPEIKQAIKDSVGAEKLGQLAMEQGMCTLRMDAIQKVFQGLTDLRQVNKVSA